MDISRPKECIYKILTHYFSGELVLRQGSLGVVIRAPKAYTHLLRRFYKFVWIALYSDPVALCTAAQITLPLKSITVYVAAANLRMGCKQLNLTQTLLHYLTKRKK